MSDKNKKIIFAVVFIFLSIAIGVGLYILFFKPLIAPVEITEEESQFKNLPKAGVGGPRPGVAEPAEPGGLPISAGEEPEGVPTGAETKTYLLRDAVTQALKPSPNGGARFYSPNDGRFYKMNADGSISTLSEKQFFNVEEVSWGNRDDKAVLEFPDGSNVVYDFEAKKQVTLPKHWEDFNFSPDDERIVSKSIGLDPSNRFLIVSKTDGNEAQAIESLGNNGHLAQPVWSPNNQIIAFSKTGNPQPEGAEEIFLIGENHEKFKSLIVPGRGFMPNWSPTGREILYSVFHERDDYKPSLWISLGSGDQIGEARRGLNLNTWANKCAWRNDEELFCGVPQSLGVGAGMDPERYSNIPDDIYRVNLKTGVSTKISTPDQIHPVRQPIVSADGKQLIFTDSVTGRLYKYDLP